MSDDYARIAFSEHVKAAQEHYGSRAAISRWVHQQYASPTPGPGPELTTFEREFLAEKDGFYIATVSDTGWPYVQFRGGPPGFVECPDTHTLTWPDFRGNRQYITTGNLDHDPRVALFFMDYPNRLRLKIFGTASVVDVRDDRSQSHAQALRGYVARVERRISVHVDAYDWNCPQHITPRYTESEIQAVTAPLQQRVRDLEEQLAQVRLPADHGS